MSKELRYTKELIELRRSQVLDLVSKGKTGADISRILGVSTSLISLDIQWIKSKAQEAMNTHIQETLPYDILE